MSLTALIQQYKAAVFAVMTLLILLGGAGLGWFLTHRYYLSLMEDAQNKIQQAGKDLAACKAARDNLVELTGEQGRALASLKTASDERQQQAGEAMASAHDQSRQDYQAANRLQQERTGGGQCPAAESVIDRELGL